MYGLHTYMMSTTGQDICPPPDKTKYMIILYRVEGEMSSTVKGELNLDILL